MSIRIQFAPNPAMGFSSVFNCVAERPGKVSPRASPKFLVEPTGAGGVITGSNLACSGGTLDADMGLSIPNFGRYPGAEASFIQKMLDTRTTIPIPICNNPRCGPG